MEGFWKSFPLDPRQPGNMSMRVSDADREIVRVVLAEAYSDGRLTRQEHDDRADVLYGTRTLGDLAPLVAGLVPPAEAPCSRADLEARGARKWRRDVGEALKVFLIVGITSIAVWFESGRSGFFWPVFPLLVFGIRLVSKLASRKSAIEHEARRVERQAASKAPPNATDGRHRRGGAPCTAQR